MAVNLDVMMATANAATPGPWDENIESDGCGTYFATGPHIHKDRNMDKKQKRDVDNQIAADAKFIAAARIAVPELIETLHKLNAVTKDLITRVKKHEQPGGPGPAGGSAYPVNEWPSPPSVKIPTVQTPEVQLPKVDIKQ